MSDLCKCTFAIRMNGDGCRHCQPQGYIDRLEDQAKDQSDRIERLEAVLVQAREALDWVVDQAGGPVCEHEGAVCFCKENNAIAAIDAALKE